MPHLHEKIDFVSDVYIVNGDAVLLRMHDKYKFWTVPGGHIELDEDPTQTAVREAKEETGLDITLMGEYPHITEGEMYKELLPARFMNRHRIDDTHEHVAFIYFATSATRDIHDGSEREKSESMKWFTKEELESFQFEIRETIRFYAKAALEESQKSTRIA